jgi:glycosyltransferase involved in cell wall biosynthesis
MTDDTVVRVVVLLPADPLSRKIGGIQSFVHDFISRAPADFRISVVGVTANRGQRPVGQWGRINVGDREVEFLPVAAIEDVHRRQRIPIALTYTLGLVRHRELIETKGRILQFHRAGTALAFLNRRGPAIQVVHLNVADIYGQAGESRWRLLPGMYHRVEDLTIGQMSRIFVVNEAGADFYRRRHPRLATRIEFMPTWYDDAAFAPWEPDRRWRLRDDLSAELAGDFRADRLLLFVGRLERQKDPHLLIEAFLAALVEDRRLRLLIVGDGDLRAAAEQHAAASEHGDRIHFLGWRSREDVANLMAVADCLLLASRFEGMPITVLEALASGLPVAATAVGEVPRVVRDRDTGALAAERTPTALASAIRYVLEHQDQLRDRAVAMAANYAASRVLGEFYQAHRDAVV